MSEEGGNGGTIPPRSSWFKPGQSGNPGGMPKGTRTHLTRKFVAALADDFDLHGAAAIAQCRETDPAKYVQIVANLMPKQIEPSLPLDDMNDEQLITAIDYLRRQIADRAGAGSNTTGRTQ